MTYIDDFIKTFDDSLTADGTLAFSFAFYPRTYSGADYDDAYGRETISGAVMSGACQMQNISSRRGGEDYKFLEEGAVKLGDRKIFVSGSLD